MNSKMVREYLEMNKINEDALNCEWTRCKKCKEEVPRIKSDKYPNGKDFRYLDKQGRHWSGLKCPQCHTNANALRQKNARANKRLYV